MPPLAQMPHSGNTRRDAVSTLFGFRATYHLQALRWQILSLKMKISELKGVVVHITIHSNFK